MPESSATDAEEFARIRRPTRHPALALGFMMDHWAQVEPLLGDDSGATVVSRFFNEGYDLGLDGQLDVFAARHIPGKARRAVDKAESIIRYRAAVRQSRLPELDRWLVAADRP